MENCHVHVQCRQAVRYIKHHNFHFLPVNQLNPLSFASAQDKMGFTTSYEDEEKTF